MLVLEFALDESVVLEDRATGKRLAEVKIAAITHYPNETKINLGFDAPHSTNIQRTKNRTNGLELRNGSKHT